MKSFNLGSPTDATFVPSLSILHEESRVPGTGCVCLSALHKHVCEACCLVVRENRVADIQVRDLSGHHLEILNNVGTRGPVWDHGWSQTGADFPGTQGVSGLLESGGCVWPPRFLLAGRAT